MGGSRDQRNGEVRGKERLMYDDRRLFQDYVRGLPRSLGARQIVEPGKEASRRKKRDCEGDEND